MNRIRLLSEQVANQIAAGEVVERPASVVKELVENALDARATRIAVEVQAGGRSLIRVTDDGLGMSRDDALLCLERHATSKIQTAQDLQTIATMGFRGEALPSIASVSRLTLTTRERETEGPTAEATQIVVHGGKILEVKAAGAPIGTCVEVRGLFFNLPARRKFLRSEETERTHLQHYLTLAALAHPEVTFTFTHDQRQVWHLPALKTGSDPASRLTALQERWRGLTGLDLTLLRVNFQAPLPAGFESEREPDEVAPLLRVWGLIGAPGVSRATRENQHLFVNGRPIEHRGLNFALVEGYHTALMKGRYPVGCLFLEIDPAEVDVNIHPAKREVKFRNEKAVRLAVTQAVRQAMLSFHADGGPARPAPQTAPGTGALPEPPAVIRPTQTEWTHLPAPTPKSGWHGRPSGSAAPPAGWPGTETQREHHDATAPAAPRHRPSPPPSAGSSPLSPSSSASPPATSSPSSPPTLARSVVVTPSAPTPVAPAPSVTSVATAGLTPAEPLAATPLLSVPLRLIGVIGRLYVVLESDRGLVLLDQHAAHERVLFEQMMARMEHGHAPSQRLLLPETIELPPRDAQFVREQLETLARLGIGLSEFGERTFLLDALPPFTRTARPQAFVLDLIDALKAAGEGVNKLRLGEDTIAKTVCRHAVKAHDPLTLPELENLLADLRRCAMPYTCPHGRPTLIEISYRELERKFGRIP